MWSAAAAFAGFTAFALFVVFGPEARQRWRMSWARARLRCRINSLRTTLVSPFRLLRDQLRKRRTKTTAGAGATPTLLPPCLTRDGRHDPTSVAHSVQARRRRRNAAHCPRCTRSRWRRHA